MPNARQIGYNPTPVTGETPMPEANVYQDILSLITVGGKAVQGFAEAATQQVEEKNRELKTYLNFAEASQKAQKELGIAKTRAKIEENQNQIQAMGILDNWYEKLRQQEKIGLVSLAFGRDQNELKELLKKNPGIIDPDNLTDYRKIVASQLADMDAAEIFQTVNQSRDKFNNPTATIKSAVDSKLATIPFPDEDSRQAYVSTLLPRVVATNESLMKEGWELKRKEVGSQIRNNAKFDFINQVQNKTLNAEMFDLGVNTTAQQLLQWFPELSETTARETVQAEMFALLSDKDSPIGELDAMDAMDAIFDGQTEAMKSSKSTQAILSVAYGQVLNRFISYQNGNTQIAKTDIANSDDLELLAFSKQLQTDEAKRTFGESGVAILTNATLSRKNALQTSNNAELEKQVDTALQTPTNTANIELRVDEAFENGLINNTQYQTLVKKIRDGETKQKTYHDVWNKRTSQKGSEMLAFGKDHYPAIDLYDTEDRNSGMSIGTRLVNTVRTYGVITDNQIAEVDGLLNSPSIDTQLIGVAAIGELRDNLPTQYFASAVSNLDKLNGKGKVIAKTALLTGINPQYLVQELAGAKSTFVADAQKELNSGTIGTIQDNIADSMSSSWFGSDTPDYVSTQARDVYATLYEYNYSRIASQSGEGAATEGIARGAKEATNTMLGQYLNNIVFAGKRQVVGPTTNASIVRQMEAFAQSAATGLMRRNGISSDFILADASELGGTKIDGVDYYTIPVYNVGGLARVQIGTVLAPVDDLLRKKESDRFQEVMRAGGTRQSVYDLRKSVEDDLYNKYFRINPRFRNR